MATKKVELEMALRGEGCLGKAADDEPVFVLRAKDITAPGLVDEWAERVYAMAKFPGPSAKLEEARKLANAMREWQRNNGCKVPD